MGVMTWVWESSKQNRKWKTYVVVGYLDKGSDRPNDVKEEVVCNKGNG